MDSLTLKRHNSFQNQKKRKATQSFTPRPLIFKLQQEILKLNDIFVSWSPPKLTWWQIFKPRKSKFWERQFFSSIVTFNEIFGIHLLNNLFISFLKLFISLTELKNIH